MLNMTIALMQPLIRDGWCAKIGVHSIMAAQDVFAQTRNPHPLSWSRIASWGNIDSTSYAVFKVVAILWISKWFRKCSSPKHQSRHRTAWFVWLQQYAKLAHSFDSSTARGWCTSYTYSALVLWCNEALRWWCSEGEAVLIWFINFPIMHGW